MAKTKKKLTNSYLKYQFPDEDYDDEIPWWFDDLDVYLANKDEIWGENADVIQPIVYTLYNANKNPLYVGKSIRFDDRIKYHNRAKNGKEPWMKDVKYIGLICCGSPEEMDSIEVFETQKKLPRYSPDLKHDETEYIIPFGTTGNAFDVQTYYNENVFLYEKLFD